MITHTLLLASTCGEQHVGNTNVNIWIIFMDITMIFCCFSVILFHFPIFFLVLGGIPQQQMDSL